MIPAGDRIRRLWIGRGVGTWDNFRAACATSDDEKSRSKPMSFRFRASTPSRLRVQRLAAFLLIAAARSLPALADDPAGATRPAATLAGRLDPLIRAYKGKVAIAVKNLKTGEEFHHRGGEVMPTASLIKFPVMVEAYRQASQGKIDLDARVALRVEDKVPGSGVLTDHFSAGDRIALKDAVRLMIMFSDNTATNLVLDAIGIGATAATMESLGYPNTKIHSKVFRRDTSVFPERSKKYGLGSTTADEMVRLCQALHEHRLVSPAASDRMLEHLRTCDDRDKFPRGLPYGTKLAFKTGSVDDARTCAGLIECPGGTVAVCVLTCENEDRRWVPDNAGNLLCAEVARAVFDHFSVTPPASPKPH
ncbi:serine hydrolase [Aquisphaera insulae]|uniref:serine hydrolase n=1 Tax=Aquisphaera insulae TaxID=2712864 RepID=UPI00202FAECD|nr:serine hydrolase [Aquisphaera insulae]